MAEIIFIYYGKEVSIQSNFKDKMKDIITKYVDKVIKKRDDLIFFYYGNIINEEKTFEELIEGDNINKKVKILVADSNINNRDNEDTYKKSKESICPHAKKI